MITYLNLNCVVTVSEMLSEAVKILKGEYTIRAINKHKMDKAIIFCRTKVDCDNMEEYLLKTGGSGEWKAMYSWDHDLVYHDLVSFSVKDNVITRPCWDPCQIKRVERYPSPSSFSNLVLPHVWETPCHHLWHHRHLCLNLTLRWLKNYWIVLAFLWWQWMATYYWRLLAWAKCNYFY